MKTYRGMVICPELPEIDGKMVEYWLREMRYMKAEPMYVLREEDQDFKLTEPTVISLKHVSIYEHYFNYWVPVDVEKPFQYVLERLHSIYRIYAGDDRQRED
jgi:hypothetical protein